jgi:hypothetical protein
VDVLEQLEPAECELSIGHSTSATQGLDDCTPIPFVLIAGLAGITPTGAGRGAGVGSLCGVFAGLCRGHFYVATGFSKGSGLEMLKLSSQLVS